jgi:FkbM family methyltransferase
MVDTGLSRLLNSRLPELIQSVPVLKTLVPRVYRQVRSRQKKKYVKRDAKIAEVELSLPEIGTVYFDKFNLNYNEICFLRHILSNLDSNDVIYDVGANIGAHAIPYARNCRVVGFEPVEANRRIWKKNISLNEDNGVKLDTISIESCALSDVSGKQQFSVRSDLDDLGGYDPEAGFRQSGETEPISISAKRLDEIDLPKPDGIKIDIEGSELKMLRGGEETIEKHHPELYIETHPEKMTRYGHSPSEIYAFLEKHDYVREEVVPRGGDAELLHCR